MHLVFFGVLQWLILDLFAPSFILPLLHFLSIAYVVYLSMVLDLTTLMTPLLPAPAIPLPPSSSLFCCWYFVYIVVLLITENKLDIFSCEANKRDGPSIIWLSWSDEMKAKSWERVGIRVPRRWIKRQFKYQWSKPHWRISRSTDEFRSKSTICKLSEIACVGSQHNLVLDLYFPVKWWLHCWARIVFRFCR